MPDKDLPERGSHFYRALFCSTFLISAFTVGGGFVIIPLLKAKYVDEYGWLEDEISDLAGIIDNSFAEKAAQELGLKDPYAK